MKNLRKNVLGLATLAVLVGCGQGQNFTTQSENQGQMNFNTLATKAKPLPTPKPTPIPVPSITTISGISDGSGVSNGKWTGQPSRAPKTASNKFVNYFAIESQNPNGHSYTMTINGANFGDKAGTVSFSNNNISVTVLSWSNSKIVIRPTVPYTFTPSNVNVNVKTALGLITTKSLSVTVLIQTRGYGQCTYYVAKKRLDNRLGIQTRAFTTTGDINTSYVPTQWDIMVHGTSHVSIISSVPTRKESTIKVGKNNQTIVTYTFTISEMNSKWDEDVVGTYNATFEVNTTLRTSTKIRSNITGVTSYYR